MHIHFTFIFAQTLTHIRNFYFLFSLPLFYNYCSKRYVYSLFSKFSLAQTEISIM
jgi:hypothetical protein